MCTVFHHSHCDGEYSCITSQTCSKSDTYRGCSEALMEYFLCTVATLATLDCQIDSLLTYVASVPYAIQFPYAIQCKAGYFWLIITTNQEVRNSVVG